MWCREGAVLLQQKANPRLKCNKIATYVGIFLIYFDMYIYKHYCHFISKTIVFVNAIAHNLGAYFVF